MMGCNKIGFFLGAGEAMELNSCCDMKFDDGCFIAKSVDVKRKNFVDFEDSESEEGCKDIADLLPNDPFEMELNRGLPSDPFVMGFEISLPGDPFGMEFDVGANFKAITGWIEEFGNQASDDKNDDDSKIFTELNFFWTTSSVKYEEEEDNEIVDAGLREYSEYVSNDDHNKLAGDVEDPMCFGCEKYENLDIKVGNNADDGGDPADALFFVLGYLGVKDLLSFERVCKSLRDAVRDETLVWKNIHIDYTLSDKITDDGLLRLTNRAKGALCSLSIVQCTKITSTGLKHVLESNPGLTKLSVQGCNKLKVEGILHDLKAFNSIATPGIKHLRIGNMPGVTNQHFKEFKLLLGANEDKKPANYKPRFFRAAELDLSLDDERAIDIETCPRCRQARQVYDCPSESCQEKIHFTMACRGCIFCISRCISCGCCLDNKAYEETFCLDSLCIDCLDHLLNCKDGGVTLSPGHTYFHQKASYHFFLCGKQHDGSYDSLEGFRELDKAILEHAITRNNREGSSRRLFYLALPPSLIVLLLRSKPLGKDSALGKELSSQNGELFDEPQIYHIDHCLGKELVRNLYVLRLANLFFLPLRDRGNIANVQDYP